MRSSQVSENLPVFIALQNAADCPVNLVGKWITEAGFEIRTLHLYAKQPFPTNVRALEDSLDGSPLAGIIPLGGSISADDDDVAPWLVGEKALLADAVANSIPVFGICLGAQLLALALGGAVDLAQTPEIGMHEIEVTDSDDRLFKDVRKANLPTIQWHQDEVRDLPKGALSIASSKHCRNQIYRIGSLHYAVQFHPEADLSIVRMWEKEADEAYRRSGRSSDAAGVIEAEVALRMAEMKELWSQVIKGWAVIASQELETRLSRQ